MWPTNAGGAIGEDNWQKFQIGPPIVRSYESPLTSPFRPIQVPEPSVRSPDSVLGGLVKGGKFLG
ncbi:hypothetical protein LINPERPRIM_LOCUS28028 [Linum perenne]